ncbi:hypothetical protein [Natronospora cellulosivora (SeqCode)]
MMYFNENEYILNNGRKATATGILGLILGFIISLLLNLSMFAFILLTILIGYLFLTSYWGIYKSNFWFRKYRYKLPYTIWLFLRVFVLIAGAILGILFLGFFEHFILLLAMGSDPDGPGMIAAQIILIPFIGEKYAGLIKYTPDGS